MAYENSYAFVEYMKSDDIYNMASFYGGLFVPFRYFVLSFFRLALWRGAKTK